ncbi:MAG: sugar phosphate isomerase/epimerase, partial [Rhizobiales bacterium]|nr:sugar phosphate isomerase/epimerase [Hyphomicrobiales bacterium]
MNAFGVHALVFVSGWSQDQAARAIDRAAAAGYGYLEIPLIDPKAINVRATTKALRKAGIKPVTSLGLSHATDISSGDPEVVSRGETLLNEALSVARDLGSTMLSGVLYSALGKYHVAASHIGRWNCVQVLRRLAEKAKASDMTLGIEPVNRYESNLVNTGENALNLIKAIGADNMVVHLDSYHMNIEEGAPGPLIERLGDRLGYVHVNESHRGYLGTGSIDFDALFRALVDHRYKGVITFEAFASGIGDPKLNADLAVWRPLWDDPDDLARHARSFMEEMVDRASTPSKRAVADASAGR